MLMDVHQRGDLRFPKSLTEFQRLFPDDAACAGYLEKVRWSDGFVCPHCQAAGEPFRFANRPGVLRCRECRRDTGTDNCPTFIAEPNTSEALIGCPGHLQWR